MKNDTRYPWFILDIVLFVVINLTLLLGLKDRFIFPSTINFLQLFVFGLAVYRAADIISNEKITEPLRAPFVKIKQEGGKEIEEPNKNGFKGSFGALLYCQTCSGVWVSMVLLYLYLLWPLPTTIILLIFALSALQQFFDAVIWFLKNYTK